ncbi:NlpC/P60 family protein [Streptosporangium sp. NPDC002524]|uniref:bifunctional WXG100 family type VII secretion target/C40 family peptidase n=1 Tax=Streptosporangium sp. NPDC002524 TaxID=3154537 RepID=UPI00332D5E57
MTDMNAVAALPGGQALAALVKKVDGDPAAIRAIATRWRKAVSSSAEPFRLLNNAVNQVDTAWKGDSADAFVAYMRRYDRAGGSLRDALGDCAGSLDTAAGAVETATSNAERVCGDLLAWVAEYRRRNPHATEEQLKPGIEEQVELAVSRVRGHVDAAETALSTARRELDKHLGDTALFSAIPAAGDQDFVPAPGHTTRWVPVPEEEIRTILAGTEPGSQGGGNGGGGGGSPSGGQDGGSGSGSGGGSGGGGGGGGQAIPYTVTGDGTGADVVAAARSHIGKPYVWGADGPNAFDCSGLVHVSLNEAGIKIGDNTAAGYQASGQPITGPPQPGDIVFFGNPATHCGVYMGDGMMIAAPKPGDHVKMQSVVGASPITYRRFT